MEISFERNALYEEVWAVPLTQLAKKYGLSYNGVRKVCKAMAIPLPSAGHWAKVAAGKPIAKIPLPPDAPRKTFTSRIAEKERSFHLPEDDEWLDARIAFERNIDNQIQFDPRPRRWHPAVAPLREEILAQVKELPRIKRDAEIEAKRTAARYAPNLEGWRWRTFLHHGQVLSHTHRASPLRVTPLTYERALAILNILCFEAERRGFTVKLSEKQGRIVFEGFDGEVPLRITERLDEEWRSERTYADSKPQNKKYKVPTGKLRLYLGDTYHELLIADSAEKPIESRLNEIFVRICSKVVLVREERRKRDAWHREYEEEQRRKEAMEQLKRDQAAAKERERKKKEALIDEARAWQTAKLIREYLDYLQTVRFDHALAEVRDEEWRIWAKGVADDIDPTTRR